MSVFGKKPEHNEHWERETLEKLAFANAQHDVGVYFSSH
jgi:hypothetical protein